MQVTIPSNRLKGLFAWKSWGKLLAALVAAVALGFGGLHWLRYQITSTGYTADTNVLQVVLGNDVLSIPANLIRFKQQRNTATPEQIDLALLWPSGTGYSEQDKDRFRQTGPEQSILFVKLTKREMALDMSQRLEPIYRKLFEGPARPGPAGLTLQPLQAGSAYRGEDLAIYQHAGGLWVARCHNPEATDNPTCIRDINLGQDLSMSYRMPLRLLAQWVKIENLLLQRITQMLETP